MRIITENKPEENFDILSNKYIQIPQNLQDAIDKMHAFQIIFPNPNDNENNSFNIIFTNTICPVCGSKTYCNDCFNKKLLKITYERICHKCKTIFMFTCKYESKLEFQEKRQFFTNNIYRKKRVRGGLK